MTFAQRLDAAAAATTCQMLDSMGGALVGYGAVSIAAGGAGLVPLTLGAVALLASNVGCTWDPNKDGPKDQGPLANECWQTSGTMCLDRFTDGNLVLRDPCDIKTWLGTTSVTDFGDGNKIYYAEYIDDSGVTKQTNYQISDRHSVAFYTGGLPCETPGPGNNPVPPYAYTDPDTGCQLTVAFQGMALDPSGVAAPVYKIEPAAQTRAGGGVISGCNFEPVFYYGGPPDQPPIYGPWDPGWPDWDGSGTPPWVTALIGAAGGVAASVIDNALAALFETKYPAGTREIYAACNYKQDGNPETFSVTFPEENYQNRVLTSLNAIVDFQQQILLWKTPTCSGGGSSVSGEAVTLNWVSDEYSSAGGNRIRKLLTYFDQVGSTLEQTVAHWKDFTWDAGPVIVSVNDVPLGKPQVWAASEAEGKRVINHAAAIAGVDMTNASWLVTSPRASRYGETGTMRIHRSKNGTLGITKRDGPSGLPPALG